MRKKCRLTEYEFDGAAKININIPIFANRSKLDLFLFFFIKKNNNKNIHGGLTKCEFDGAVEININIPIKARSSFSFLLKKIIIKIFMMTR